MTGNPTPANRFLWDGGNDDLDIWVVLLRRWYGRFTSPGHAANRARENLGHDRRPSAGAGRWSGRTPTARSPGTPGFRADGAALRAAHVPALERARGDRRRALRPGDDELHDPEPARPGRPRRRVRALLPGPPGSRSRAPGWSRSATGSRTRRSSTPCGGSAGPAAVRRHPRRHGSLQRQRRRRPAGVQHRLRPAARGTRTPGRCGRTTARRRGRSRPRSCAHWSRRASVRRDGGERRRAPARDAPLSLGRLRRHRRRRGHRARDDRRVARLALARARAHRDLDRPPVLDPPAAAPRGPLRGERARRRPGARGAALRALDAAARAVGRDRAARGRRAGAARGRRARLARPCGVVSEHEAGDHTVFVGAVERVELGRPRDALVYLESGYRSL